MRANGWVMLVAALGLVTWSTNAQARGRRACTDAACVDVVPGVVDPSHPSVRITNRGAEPLTPRDYTFAVECAAGVYETHSVTLGVNVPPQSNVVLYPAQPVCVGHQGPYYGLHVLNMPGTTVYVGALATRAVVETAVASSAGSSCLGFPSLNLGSGCGNVGSCGSGGGDGAAVIIAAVLAVVGVMALGALALVAAGLCAVGLGWAVPKAIKHRPLDWWVALMLMEIPVGLGVAAGVAATVVGGVGAYTFSRNPAFDGNWVLGSLLAGVGVAVVALVLGGLVGTTLVVVSSLVFTDKEPKDLAELGDGINVEAQEFEPSSAVD